MPTPRIENHAAVFEEIYDAHFGYVWHALRRLGIKQNDLEDLTQDVFVVVHRRLTDYDASRPLRPWLFGISYRVARDFRRRAFHHRETGAESSELASSERPPDEIIATQQKRRLIEKALGKLDMDKRAVFIMHDIDEQSMPQIAEALALPLNTAYSRLRLARRAFAKTVNSLAQDGGAL